MKMAGKDCEQTHERWHFRLTGGSFAQAVKQTSLFFCYTYREINISTSLTNAVLFNSYIKPVSE